MFRRLPAADQPVKHDLVDVGFENRGNREALDWSTVCVLLITTTSLVSSCQLPFADVWSFVQQSLSLIVMDEAQQFPDAADAWLLTLSEKPPLFLLIGDQAQPAGASSSCREGFTTHSLMLKHLLIIWSKSSCLTPGPTTLSPSTAIAHCWKH